jgi:AraC-like DNA-binding protein
MEILFNQKQNNGEITGALELFGIERCILKQILFEKDRTAVIKKSHYHRNFEIHIISSGYQDYEISGHRISVSRGQFLLISPLVKHKVISADPCTEKYAITFNAGESGKVSNSLYKNPPFVFGNIPKTVEENIRKAELEKREARPFGYFVSEGLVFECIIHFMRLLGLREKEKTADSYLEESARLSLCKQYIDDNIYAGVSVTELASYSCISERQLERIFSRELGVSVMEYVRAKRCEKIEKFLSGSEMTLLEISEKMHFSNEYHFNSFFKKYAGMSPGAYRKSASKNK